MFLTPKEPARWRLTRKQYTPDGSSNGGLQILSEAQKGTIEQADDRKGLLSDAIVVACEV
jgi:hypothetical protein